MADGEQDAAQAIARAAIERFLATLRDHRPPSLRTEDYFVRMMVAAVVNGQYKSVRFRLDDVGILVADVEWTPEKVIEHIVLR